MTYAVMIFFILAILTGLFGFTSSEGGGEPGAAAMARLFAMVFAAGFVVAGGTLILRRYRVQAERGAMHINSTTVENRSQDHGRASMAFVGDGGSASERGSWDGSRRSSMSKHVMAARRRRLSSPGVSR